MPVLIPVPPNAVEVHQREQAKAVEELTDVTEGFPTSLEVDVICLVEKIGVVKQQIDVADDIPEVKKKCCRGAEWRCRINSHTM